MPEHITSSTAVIPAMSAATTSCCQSTLSLPCMQKVWGQAVGRLCPRQVGSGPSTYTCGLQTTSLREPASSSIQAAPGMSAAVRPVG